MTIPCTLTLERRSDGTLGGAIEADKEGWLVHIENWVRDPASTADQVIVRFTADAALEEFVQRAMKLARA